MNGVRWLSWPALLLPLMVGLSLLAGPAVGAEEPSPQEQALEEQMPEDQSLEEAPMDIEALEAPGPFSSGHEEPSASSRSRLRALM
jgi:hypothetical protein